MKFINDMLGHQEGNLLLQHIAERLSDLLEEGDFLARFGGDEFIILVANDRVNTVEEIAKRCVEQMRAPFIVHGHPISITLSAGLCTYPREASNADELLQYADLAMSESKRNGKNEATAFTLSLNEQYRRKLQIEEALTTALSHGELHLVYQPKIRMRTEEIEGVEALLRWTHPEYGPISPVEFIPIAEEKGLIHTIGEWVLRASCLQWVSWSRELAEPPIVAVNISPIQLTRDDFLPTLLEIIEETAMDPRYLELEIKESASLGFEEKSRALLEKIRTLGIHISLDDFGTGYSSFSHLKELPIDVLKIDRSFLRQLIGNKGQEAIVRSIIHLGHNLNFRVLVEGAEKKEEVDWLREAGCDFVQGYYYSKPEMPERILQLMRHEGQPHG